jgi:thiol-disulfide isomerase/thioredoxin
MATTVLRGNDKKEEAKELLKKQPLLVLFFMDGCPHCDANKPAWEEAKKKANVPTAEIESSATPEEEATGFPTMKYKSSEGTKETTGQKKSGDEILDELKVPKKSAGGRRRRLRSRRHVNRRGGRKSRHRTLSSYVTF